MQREQEAREDGKDADTDANKYMTCLLEACASNTPKLVTTALDAMVKVSPLLDGVGCCSCLINTESRFLVVVCSIEAQLIMLFGRAVV